jgi:hypothetical protein
MNTKSNEGCKRARKVFLQRVSSLLLEQRSEVNRVMHKASIQANFCFDKHGSLCTFCNFCLKHCFSVWSTVSQTEDWIKFSLYLVFQI